MNNMLTIERAIADAISPAQLRMVADSNWAESTRYGRDEFRLKDQAQNLRRVADRLELVGFGRRNDEKRAA